MLLLHPRYVWQYGMDTEAVVIIYKASSKCLWLNIRNSLTLHRWHWLNNTSRRMWMWCLLYHWWLGYLRHLNMWNLTPAWGWRESCVGRWNPSPTGRRRWRSMGTNTSARSRRLCMIRETRNLWNLLTLLPPHWCVLCNHLVPQFIVSISHYAYKLK